MAKCWIKAKESDKGDGEAQYIRHGLCLIEIK